MHLPLPRASDSVHETQAHSARPHNTAAQMTPPPRHHAAPPLAALVLLLLLLVAPAAAQPPSRDKDNGGGAGGGGYMQQNQAPGFSAPMVVLLVALIVGFFFIGFFSVYMRRCGRAASPGGPSIPAAALLALSRQEQRDRQQQRGLDPAVLASFPTMRYAEARELRVGGKDAALECAVCLSEFDDDEELRLLPKCSHAFHTDCIGEWLAGHVTCPVCRCNLNPEEELAADEANGSGEVAGDEQQGADRVVAIDVGRDGSEVEEEEEEERRREEAVELERIGSQRRALRSRSGRRPPAPPLVPPRSHSTGHSLGARLDGDLERFTLRLPEHVRREMVAAGEESLRRTGPAGAGRDREGGRAGAARSARLGRSDRWPSFITRTFSSRVPFWSASRRAPVPDAEAAAGAAPAGTTEASAATARSKREKTAEGGSVTTPKGSVRFDCLSGAAAAVSGARVGAAAGDSETEDDDEEKAIAGLRQA